jgi:membrane protein YqaA with SNARE-associated domain
MDIASFFGGVEAFAGFIYASPFGMVVLFLFALLANATILFPILVEPVVLALAAIAPDPYTAMLIGVVTGVAAAIGEMTSYFAGRLGVETLRKMHKQQVEQIFKYGEKLANKGIPILVFGAFTPFPFDVMGLAAGVIKYSWKKFFIAALIGKIPRYTLVAIAGFYGLAGLKAFFGL